MYRVNVLVSVLARNGIMGLSRWLFLPFAPYPGLDLHGITANPDEPETVNNVAWDVAEECFRAELVGLESDVDDIAELIDSYGPEWELHELGTEPVQEL